jgi:hemerythrin
LYDANKAYGGSVNEAVNLWKPEYRLDIDTIDEQHKGLFDICLKCATLCEASRTKPIQPQDIIIVTYNMRGYAFRHFQTEELLLLKYRYPKIYEHVCLHDEFLLSLQEFTAELHGLAGAESADQQTFLACANRINDYLANWWGEHILNVDQDYARFIHERKGQTP